MGKIGMACYFWIALYVRKIKNNILNLIDYCILRCVTMLFPRQLVLIDGIPDGLYDMWEVTGKRPEAKFTWDCMRNDNLEMSGKFKPRARFDRVYLSHCEPKPKLKPVYFELVGIERLPCQRFPSDHWGILTHYDKV